MNSPALLYHKVDHPTPDVRIRGAFTSPRRFERQMAFLKRTGCDFLFASEFFRYFRDHGSFPVKSICVTFDDGWKDNYTHAFPVLKKLGIKASIFLVTDCIGIVSDAVTADGEGGREHLSVSDIREMAAGGIEFGSHSMSHRLLDRLDPQDTEEEVFGSKNFVENLLQKACDTFAYPAGYYTAVAQDAIKRAGYIGAFSTIHGPQDHSDIYALNRSEILKKHGRPFQYSRYLRTALS